MIRLKMKRVYTIKLLLILMAVNFINMKQVSAEHIKNDGILVGVWNGKIGQSNVTLCVNNDNTGKYYYNRYTQPIDIITQNNNTNFTIKEKTGLWQITNLSSQEINGFWVSPDNHKKYDIKLNRNTNIVKDNEENSIEPCSSDAYHKLLDQSLSTHYGPTVSLNNIKFHQITITYPGELYNEKYNANIIELLGNSNEIRKINNELFRGETLKQITSELMDDIISCQHSEKSSYDDATYTYKEIISIVGKYATINTSIDNNYCTEVDPQLGHDEYVKVFNLNSGEKENLISWFKFNNANHDNERQADRSSLPDELYDFIVDRLGHGDPLQHFDRDELDQCYGTPSSSFLLKLTAKGINFVLPLTGNYSCGDSIEISYKDLMPFLNQYGKKEVQMIIHP